MDQPRALYGDLAIVAPRSHAKPQHLPVEIDVVVGSHPRAEGIGSRREDGRHFHSGAVSAWLLRWLARVLRMHVVDHDCPALVRNPN